MPPEITPPIQQVGTVPAPASNTPQNIPPAPVVSPTSTPSPTPVVPSTSPSSNYAFGIDPATVQNPKAAQWLQAVNNAAQDPTSQTSQLFLANIHNGTYNDLATDAGIDLSKYPGVFQTGVSQPSSGNSLENNLFGSGSSTNIPGDPLGVNEVNNAGSDVMNAISSGVQTFGKALSTINLKNISPLLPTTGVSDTVAKINQQNNASQELLLAAIHNQTDPAKRTQMLSAYNSIWGQTKPLTDADLNPAYSLTPEQVAGAAAETATDILGAGALPEAGGEVASQGVGQGIVKGAVTGAEFGGAMGAEKGMQNNEGVGGVVGSGLEGAATGAITGSAIGGATAGIAAAPARAAANQADQEMDSTVANIARGEGGIGQKPVEAKTPTQVAQESQQATWDVIKPKLSPDELKTAATSGGLVRTGENGVLTQVPTPKDIADIKLAQPYVEAAGGDPVKTAANIKQGIADTATQLEDAVKARGGGTWSGSNIKGVMNDVKVPLAIKDTAEMTQVNNIKNFVSELADNQTKDASGALNLPKSFRASINNEFGENIWSSPKPIGNYIRSANQALNDFAGTRLPEGTLDDGSTIADSFKKQTGLYRILDNIQIPKVGDQLVTPTEEAPLKIPKGGISKLAAEHPVITKAIKTAGHTVGLGTAVGIAEHLIE